MKTPSTFRHYCLVVASGLAFCYLLGTAMAQFVPSQFPTAYTSK